MLLKDSLGIHTFITVTLRRERTGRVVIPLMLF